MNSIEKLMLIRVDFQDSSPYDFFKKEVQLRDGRDAIIWVEKSTGHGILDWKFWQTRDYYEEKYRTEYSAEINNLLEPTKHLEIYRLKSNSI